MSESSDVRKLKQEVANLQAMLAEAQKMTAIGELLSTTTHEFNNLLMTMLNYAKLGLRHRDDETREKALTKINEAAERAAKITNGILGMARNRSRKLEPTALATLLEETLMLLDREMKKFRISVETQIDDVPNVIANGNQIQQVMLNLLINARQAMPDGGRLVVRLSHQSDRGFAELLIRDSGCGIAADRLPRIFEPFFTTKSGPDETGKGGTGLGLSSCRTIIEAHHGRIRVDSTPGKGTAFTIKLPVASVNESVGLPHHDASIIGTDQPAQT